MEPGLLGRVLEIVGLPTNAHICNGRMAIQTVRPVAALHKALKGAGKYPTVLPEINLLENRISPALILDAAVQEQIATLD